jgi:DNA-binding GntR family transcriptional regulator
MSEGNLGVVGVVDAASRILRERIFAGRLTSETAVTEAWASAEFGIARPSAKAAIEQLVSSGLLVRSAHRTARVATIDAIMVQDVYRTRARLEAMVLRELAAVGEVPREAVAANEEIEGMPPGPDAATVEPDIRFHTALIDGIASERTSRMYRSLLDEARLCMAQVQDRRLLDAKAIAAQHEGILEAVRNRDGDKASMLLFDHLSGAERRLIEAIST